MSQESIAKNMLKMDNNYMAITTLSTNPFSVTPNLLLLAMITGKHRDLLTMEQERMKEALEIADITTLTMYPTAGGDHNCAMNPSQTKHSCPVCEKVHQTDKNVRSHMNHMGKLSPRRAT